MKKLISVVLSAMLLMTSLLCVSAEKSEADISVSILAFDVQVRVTTEATEGRMTAILRDKNNTVWIDMDQTAEYEETENGNVYTFNLMMQPTRETGTYTVTVGGNVAVTSCDFDYINVNSVISFYDRLDEADADEIHESLCGEDYVLTYDLSAYKALDEDICVLVDKEIEDWDLAADLDNIATLEKSFVAAMDDVISRAQIADKNTATDVWKDAIAYCDEKEILETEYMDEGEVDAATVQAYLNGLNVDTIEAEELQTALDEAQLLAVADELDYVTLHEAFDFYLEKGIISIKDKWYKNVCKKDKADDLFKALKEKDNSTIEKLEDNVNEIADEILDELEGGGSSTGGGGGAIRPSAGGAGGVVMSGDATGKVTEEVVYDVDFSDLNEAAWATTAVTKLAESGIISGRDDGKFYPNDIVTREEFVKIIITAFDAPDEEASASFDDVAQDRWSQKYIATANRLGLVTGLDEKTFNPTGTMTRQDMAVIMHRAMKLASVEDGVFALEFSDAGSIANYAVDAVKQLAGKKIINGMGDGTFAPKGTVTRAQAAKVVYELLALIGGVN